MSKEKAFPCEYEIDSHSLLDRKVVQSSGMDLRDYFAAKAMQGLTSDMFNHIKDYRVLANEDGIEPIGLVARMSYEFADAMMTERKKEK